MSEDELPPDLERLAAALRAAGPATEPSRALAARVLAIPDAEAARAATPAVAPLARRRRLGAWQAATAALAVVAAVLAVVLVTGRTQAPTTVSRLAFTPNAAAGATASGTARLEQVDGGRRLRVDLRGLAPVDAGFYQLWISTDPDHRIAIGAFRPGADGRVDLTFDVPQLDPRWKAVWLTREPEDGNPHWTDDWIVKGKLA